MALHQVTRSVFEPHSNLSGIHREHSFSYQMFKWIEVLDGCPNLMVGHMSVCFDNTTQSIDDFDVHSEGRVTITKFITEIDTTGLELCKLVINSRLQKQFETVRCFAELSNCT
ncbi:hypothetical protein EVAR_43679_1 [Eumeta japonica]|uniref:Uncharacterized protein n=1 Tax=Eumeta variegata TaxID=151549 RepID=A0A4C1X0K0_EUMVA|nr:hypothetical protein EVAR_43679_1 [Eumeta japonica]